MAITVADLQIKAEGNTRDAENSIDRLNSKIGQTPGFLSQATSTAAGFIIANGVMRAVGAATDFAADAIIGFNSKLEQAQIGFTTMLGSAEKADTFLRELGDFAAKTPFRFEGLVSSSQRLLAMGFSAEEVIPVMTSLGDAVAALGAGDEGINRATFALGQMRAAGKVTAQDMNQLTQLGIPAWDILADKIGVSTGEVRKLAEQGIITADQAIQALMEGMDERFGGLMANQSRTFSGAMSTILDVSQQTIANAFKPMFDVISEIVVALADFLQTEGFQAWAASVGKTMADAISAVMDFFGTVSEVIGTISTLLSGEGTKFMTPFEDMAAGWAEWAGGLLQQAVDFGITLANTIIGWLLEIVPALLEVGMSFANFLLDALPSLVENANALRTQIITWILELVPQITDAVQSWIGALLGWAANFMPRFGEVAGQVFGQMIDWLEGMVPVIVEAVQLWLLDWLDWLTTEGIQLALDALGGLVDAFVAFIGDGSNIARLVEKLVTWAIGIVKWIATDLIPRVLQALPGLIAAFLGFLAENFPKIIGAFINLGAGIITGLLKAIAPLIGELGAFLAALPGKLWSALLNVGKKVIEGIWAGIQQLAGWIIQQVQNFVSNLISNIAGALGIHSPSKVMAGFGEQMVRGLAEGILDNARLAEKAMVTTLDRVADASAPAIDFMASIGQGVAPSQPFNGPVPVEGMGSGLTVIIQAERFVGTPDEARYYSDLIAAEMRLRLPN